MGNGTDVSADVAPGFISEAIGSFDSVTGVTSESGYVGGVPPLVPNTFSLQLNTNHFATSACNGAAAPAQCVGWQQFVYSAAHARAFVQYWLIGYNTTCPTGWNTSKSGTDCWINSSNSVSIPAQTIANLENLVLAGQANPGGVDTIIMATGSTLYSAQNADNFLNLAQGWHAAEFNIVGDCCLSQAVFNSGSTIVVRTSVDHGTPSAPSCVGRGFTGETNNLSFVQASAFPLRESLPAVVFTQSNSSSTTPPCDAVATVAASSSKTATHDFNGDGVSDILWRDIGGNVMVWFMNCNAALLSCAESSSANFGSAGANWSIVGQRDFTGDGKTDILGRDTSGNVGIWFTNGTQAQFAQIASISTAWSIVGTGDFNGDGRGDILWRDTSGNVVVWLMNCNATQLSCASSSANVGLVPVNWSIAGIADFSGDGKSDILWRDTSGNVGISFMNGAQAQFAQIGNVPTAWSIVGTGDFNGDGVSDILWRDTSGNVMVWFMNCDAAELSCTSSAVNFGAVSTSWSVAVTGDFNGDGKTDILWRDTSGNVGIWFMNGAQSLSASIGIVPTVWSIQRAHAD